MGPGRPAVIERIWRYFGVWYQRTGEDRPPGTDWLTGRTLTYRGIKDGVTQTDVVHVTSDTRVIEGITAVAVSDVATHDGKLLEKTTDWYAQDKQGTVWYFGEATIEMKPGHRWSSAGSWEAGDRGALPGIVMPGAAKPGGPYRQAYYPNWAEDMGQIVAVGETVTVPAGTFTNCLRTKEWSLLESGGEKRWYAPGVGVVRSEAVGGELVVLVSIKRP